jgi:beta-phosphoglucomutase-like phosphatase (HAD superfamily)
VRLQAVLFDMDGTLVDSERVTIRVWLDAAVALGLPLDEADCLAVVGLDSAASDRRLAAALGGDMALAAVRAEARRRLEGIEPVARFPLKAGAAELLALLRARGVRCAVASSSRAHEIDERLAQVGVLHHFEVRAGGDQVPRGKPDPAVYRLACARLGVDPAACLALRTAPMAPRPRWRPVRRLRWCRTCWRRRAR